MKEINDQTFIVDITSKSQQTQSRRFDPDSNDLKPILISNLKCKLQVDEKKNTSNNHYDVQSLLQLKLSSPGLLDQLSNYSYKFLCLKQRPLYIENTKTKTVPQDGRSILESRHYHKFVGCFLLVTTQQDGFLYFVQPDKHNTGQCLSFPFTSQLIDVCMDNTTVQALTENGIEIYTLGHQVFSEIYQKGVPSLNKSVCLIGLRPFLSVHKILLSNTNLVLLANTNNSETKIQDLAATWTVYNLSTPKPETIFHDFEDLAKKKYSKNRNAFINLIEEAHMVVKTSLIALKLCNGIDDTMENAAVVVLEANSSKEIADLYKDSLILLGDLYSLASEQSEYKLSLPYYQMADLNLIDIVKRFKKLQNGEMKCSSSLIYILKNYLLECIQDKQQVDVLLSTSVNHEDFIPNEVTDMEALSPSKVTVKFGEIIIEILVKYASTELAPFVLTQLVLLDYITSSMVDVIKGFKTKSAEDVLLLCLVLTKRNDVCQAKQLLDNITPNLLSTLKRHYDILFDVTVSKDNRIVNFSDFSEIFFLNSSHTSHHRIFIDVCMFVIFETQFLDYDSLLKLFMDYLSALIGQKTYIMGQDLVQQFLEKYFAHINISRTFTNLKGDDYNSFDIFSSNSEPTSLTSANNSETDNSMRKSIRILIRLYLTHLKYATNNVLLSNAQHKDDLFISQSEEYFKMYNEKIDSFFLRNKHPDSDVEIIPQTKHILFYDRRHSYLDLMPPFENNLLTEDALQESSQLRKLDSDVYVNLLKLQSILCNSDISNDIYKDVAQFLQANPELVGSEAILSCVYSTSTGVEFILEKCPQAVLQYAIDKFKTESEWIALVKLVQNKINALDEANNITGIILYYRTLRGEFLFLNHLISL